MVNKCCVPRCKRNYANGPKVHVFSFPNECNLKDRWIQSICRKSFVPSIYSKVWVHIFDSTAIQPEKIVDGEAVKIATPEVEESIHSCNNAKLSRMSSFDGISKNDEHAR